MGGTLWNFLPSMLVCLSIFPLFRFLSMQPFLGEMVTQLTSFMSDPFAKEDRPISYPSWAMTTSWTHCSCNQVALRVTALDIILETEETHVHTFTDLSWECWLISSTELLFSLSWRMIYPHEDIFWRLTGPLVIGNWDVLLDSKSLYSKKPQYSKFWEKNHKIGKLQILAPAWRRGDENKQNTTNYVY